LREEFCAPFEERAEARVGEVLGRDGRGHDAEVAVDVGEDLPDELGVILAVVRALSDGEEPFEVRPLGKGRGEHLRPALAGIRRRVEEQGHAVVQGQEGLPLRVGDAGEIAERPAEVREAGEKLVGRNAVDQVGNGSRIGD